MKQLLILLLVLALILCACGKAPEETTPTTETTAATTAETTVPETTAETTVPETSAPEITDPVHSELYIPGISVEDVILYFNEVSLDAEFVNSGDPSVLQKWTEPIQYILYGSYTEEDYAVLTDFVPWLNTIEGFPGMSETQDLGTANLKLHFCGYSEFIDLMGDSYTGCDGGVTFWYNEDNEIYDATIGYVTEIDQEVRNSVILEEIYNGLGPVQDTALRPDSIIYSDFSQPQELTEIDELILKLLYHPQMECGMNAAECEAVIRQLYY